MLSLLSRLMLGVALTVFCAPAGVVHAQRASRPLPTDPARLIASPYLPYPVYVVSAEKPDDRSARQRCWDAEIARLKNPATALDRRTIDLRCSQR